MMTTRCGCRFKRETGRVYESVYLILARPETSRLTAMDILINSTRPWELTGFSCILGQTTYNVTAHQRLPNILTMYFYAYFGSFEVVE
jgi:hypothetical protein